MKEKLSNVSKREEELKCEIACLRTMKDCYESDFLEQVVEVASLRDENDKLRAYKARMQCAAEQD